MGLSVQKGRDILGHPLLCKVVCGGQARRAFDFNQPPPRRGPLVAMSLHHTAPAPLQGSTWRAYGFPLTEVSAVAPPPLVGMV